jgi:hypothetical protein
MQRRRGFSNIASPFCSGSNSFTTLPSKFGDQRRRSLGEVAQPSEIAVLQLIDIARLRKGDPVWVKRSDKSWTYAIVKELEIGSHDSIHVMVSQGATKTLSMNQCARFLRKVADDEDDILTVEVDESIADTTPNTDSTMEELDDSIRTFLDSVELYILQHRDDINGMSMQQQAESMHRFVDDFCSQYFEDEHSPMTKLARPVEYSCPRRTDSKDIRRSPKPSISKQQKRRVMFNLNQDQSPNSFVLNKESDTRDSGTTQQTNMSPKRRPELPQPIALRDSWSMEMNQLAECLLNLPNKKLDLCQMSPRWHGNMKDHHSREFLYSRLSVIPPPPYGHPERSNTEKVVYLDKKLSITKKKLNEVNQGEGIPLSHGISGFESFQHALKSIQRRSSVYLPPSGGGVTLH